MKRTYAQAAKFLQSEFPHRVNVTGSNQPIAPMLQLLSNVLSAVQLFTVAAAIFGDGIFLGLGTPPTIYYTIRNHYAYMYMFGVFWMIPTILNKYIITGAFEVFVDGDLVYSKLERGRMPTAQDLLSPLIELGLVPVSSSS